MRSDSNGNLIIGISLQALFDLENDSEIYRQEGVEGYSRYQIQHEKEVMKPGMAFPLIKTLLGINSIEQGSRKAQIIVMSQNSADTSLRIFNSIEHYGLDISHVILTGGANVAPYLAACKADLFLAANREGFQEAACSNIPVAYICENSFEQKNEIGQLRIAFDGDAVMFSENSERIYREKGMEAFLAHERSNALSGLPEGPFAKLLGTLSYFQNHYPENKNPLRTALITERNAQAYEKIIRALREWGVRIDEAFFLGGIGKKEVLETFGAHIFFDNHSFRIESQETNSYNFNYSPDSYIRQEYSEPDTSFMNVNDSEPEDVDIKAVNIEEVLEDLKEAEEVKDIEEKNEINEEILEEVVKEEIDFDIKLPDNKNDYVREPEKEFSFKNFDLNNIEVREINLKDLEPKYNNKNEEKLPDIQFPDFKDISFKEPAGAVKENNSSKMNYSSNYRYKKMEDMLTAPQFTYLYNK